MNRSFLKNYLVLLAAGLVLLFSACATTHIPDDLSPAEIIQRAQEASDHNRYRVALHYYQTLLERYPFDIDIVCAAEYEIAFIHYKQRKYTEARAGLNALLERYDSPDQELLPPQFRRLAHIVLDSITEKEKPRFPFTLFRSN